MAESWAPSASVLGDVGLGLNLGGVVAQSIAAYKTGQATKKAYTFQSGVAKANAQLDEYQAENALERGAITKNNIWQKGAQQVGTQQAEMAARGLDISQGSPLDIMTATQFFTNANAAQAGDQAANEAWALRMAAATQTSNAQMLQDRADVENPGQAAGTTLLTGLGKVAASWYSDASRNVTVG